MSDSTVFVALIGAAGTIVAAVITVILTKALALKQDTVSADIKMLMKQILVSQATDRPNDAIDQMQAVRTITTLFEKWASALDRSGKPRHKQLADQLRDWTSFPNALGSEAAAASLVGQVERIAAIPETDRPDLDRVLRALGQRAEGRERKQNNDQSR